MALTLSYTVQSLKVKEEVNAEGATLPNAVVQTYWRAHGTDEAGNVGEFSGATPFSAATVPEGSFTPFADLQEADVIAWISAVVEADEGYKAHILEQCQRQIDDDIAQDTPMPWAPDVTPDPEAVAAEGAAVDVTDPEE